MSGRNYVRLGVAASALWACVVRRSSCCFAAQAGVNAVGDEVRARYGNSGLSANLGLRKFTAPFRIPRDSPARLGHLRQCLQPGSRQRDHLERGVDSELRHEALQVGANRVRGQLQPPRHLIAASTLD